MVSVFSCFFLPWGNSWDSHNVGRGFPRGAVDLPISSLPSFTALGAALWKLSRQQRALSCRPCTASFCCAKWSALVPFTALYFIIYYRLFQVLSKQFLAEKKEELSPRWCPRARAPCCLCSSLLGGHLSTEWRSEKQRNSSMCHGVAWEGAWGNMVPSHCHNQGSAGHALSRRMAVRRFRCLQPLSPGRIQKCLMSVLCHPPVSRCQPRNLENWPS